MSSHFVCRQGPHTPELTVRRSNLHLPAHLSMPAPACHELVNRFSWQRLRFPIVAAGHLIGPNSSCAPRGTTPLIGPTSFAKEESRWQAADAKLLDDRSCLRGSPLLDERSSIAHRLRQVCLALDKPRLFLQRNSGCPARS